MRMAEEQPQVKTKKYSFWQIAIFVVVTLGLIYLISRTGLNRDFWYLLMIFGFGILVFLYVTGVKLKFKQHSLYEAVNQVIYHNDELVNPLYLDPTKVKGVEISPNHFIIDFFNDGYIFEVKENVVTGLDISTLYNARKDKEKSDLYKEIISHQKKRELREETLERAGIVPESVA